MIYEHMCPKSMARRTCFRLMGRSHGLIRECIRDHHRMAPLTVQLNTPKRILTTLRTGNIYVYVCLKEKVLKTKKEKGSQHKQSIQSFKHHKKY